MTDLAIRVARPEEFERVLQILVDGFRGRTIHQKLEQRHGMIGGRPWEHWKRRELIGFYRHHPDRVLVAERDGKLLGFVTYSLDRDREVGEIQNNAVDPAYQGQGIGTALYRVVLDIFRREGMKYAWVVTGLDEDYAQARRVYEKVGFEPLHRSVSYVQKL